ncbi:MAG: hypothetical protein JO263_03680 [Candidatus Eremiobacteraeota bacterium]|nr:hypothetical protein [Candidatus Eremiobacteraeota bacterium]
MIDSFSERLAAVTDNEAERDARANRAAEMIRQARSYRWVGIYDVGDDERTIVGSAGANPPEHPTFSTSILGAESGVVIGTLDVESDPMNAPACDDVDFLEDCAAALRPLYD